MFWCLKEKNNFEEWKQLKNKISSRGNLIDIFILNYIIFFI